MIQKKESERREGLARERLAREHLSRARQAREREARERLDRENLLREQERLKASASATETVAQGAQSQEESYPLRHRQEGRHCAPVYRRGRHDA